MAPAQGAARNEQYLEVNMGSIFSPSAPDIPDPPPPPEQPQRVKKPSKGVQQAGEREKQKRRAAAGTGSTIATGPLGTSDDGSKIGSKTVLGQ